MKGAIGLKTSLAPPGVSTEWAYCQADLSGSHSAYTHLGRLMRAPEATSMPTRSPLHASRCRSKAKVASEYWGTIIHRFAFLNTTHRVVEISVRPPCTHGTAQSAHL